MVKLFGHTGKSYCLTPNGQLAYMKGSVRGKNVDKGMPDRWQRLSVLHIRQRGKHTGFAEF